MELQEKTPRQVVLAAFAERDRLVSAPRVVVFEGGKRIEQEPAGQYEAEEALKAALQAFRPDEDFDPQTEPVMAQVLAGARNKNESAVRMLFQPRVRVRLAGPAPGQLPEPDQLVGYNSFQVMIPRGKSCLVPQIVADILDQSGIA